MTGSSGTTRSLCHSFAQAAVSSASRPAKPTAAAVADWLSAAERGSPESCEVAMPTALLNS